MQDRATFLSGAAILTAVTWLYLARMPSLHAHASMQFAGAFLMWSVMMVAMMLPSAMPFVFAFGGEHRRRRSQSLPYVSSGFFLAGYFALWTGFSFAAAWLQLALHHASLLSEAMAATSSLLAGAILLAAGVYQWTPFKDACLSHCRSPLHFLLSDWRDGSWGAVRMGIDHGLFCLGCCWLLMLLPFVAGVMNLAWMGAITVFILIEKAAPGGRWFGRAVGAALVCAGVWIITLALVSTGHA